MMAETLDFYELLGVARDTKPADIQKAYRKLARENHPDLNKDPAAESRFKDIAEAYEVLSDPTLKKKYDSFGADFRQVPDGVDPDAWARSQQRGARSPSGGGVPPDWNVQYGGGGFDGFEGDLGSIFGDLFGDRGGPGGGGGRSRGPVPGADQEVDLTVTVEDAFNGNKRSINLADASGSTRTFDVKIPAGVTDGQRIRLAGQGGRGTDGARDGDLYLHVTLAANQHYSVDGRNITVDLRLAPWEAALGASVPVDGPGGTATVKVAPGTSSGTRMRLKGRGMPNTKGAPGDLFAEVKIVSPTNVSDEQIALWEQLRDTSDFDPRVAR